MALCGGLLLGRIVPPSFAPFFLLLVVLSVLDTLQILLTNGTLPPGSTAQMNGQSPAWLHFANFTLTLPGWRFSIGIFDLLLIAAMAEHWQRRAGSLLLSLAPGAIGLFLADVFVLVTQLGNLPLVPFLTVGWLCGEGWFRLRIAQSHRQVAT